MSKHNTVALREARQKRLAARQTVATSPQSNKNVNDAKRTAAPVAKTPSTKAPVASVPANLSAAVVDATQVGKNASVDLLLYGKETENPHWVVLANGRPVAEIRLEDQEEPAKVAKIFVTETYAHGVREASAQFDFPEVMAGVRARTYMATVTGADAFKRIEAAATDKAKGELRLAKSELRDNALNMLNLVVLAQTKNFISENPLKAELYERMTESGIHEKQAVAIIESAYQAKGPAHFDACFKQAFKWMDLHPESLAELQEQIQGLNQRTPRVAESDEIPSAGFAGRNIPLETRTASTFVSDHDNSDKSSLKDALGFRARMLNTR